MSNSSQKIECEAHGEANCAYVCSHLADSPQQKWYCNYPTPEDRWPDAWCGLCEKAFQEQGEWNDANADAASVKVVCHSCYDALKGSSVAPLMEATSSTWQPLLASAYSELKSKQETLEECYDLGKHDRWDWSQETGEIVFSNAGVSAIIARIQFVGSISTVSDTWLWSWANDSLIPSTYADMLSVRTFGEAKDLAALTVPLWPATEVDGWEMTAVAARILDSAGAYRTPGENGFTFMLLDDVRRVQ